MNKHPKPSYKSKSVSLALILILILTSALDSIAAPPPPRDSGGALETIQLPPEARTAPVSLIAGARTPSNPKLDSTLADLAAAAQVSTQEAISLAQSRSLRLSGNRVHVQVVTHAPGLENAIEAISKAGGEITGVGNDDTLIQGWLPLDALETVAAQDDVLLIHRPAELQLFEKLRAGNSTTEGLAVINGPAWHTAGHTGAGVKVAIIDGGFEGYTGLLGTDLPASVTVGNFVDGEDDSQVDGTTEHGTACAEIVHDIAPDATLYLAKVSTNLDLAEAVAWAKDTHDVDIISTSLGWYNLSPGDGTGEFADLVQDARNDGILWATAASNDREAHWGGLYYDPDADDVHNFNDTQEVNFFGPGDGNAYSIPAGFPILIFLRWDDWTNVNQDYDLYLLRWSGSGWETFAESEDVQAGSPGQTPTEFIYAPASGADTAYGFVITRYSSTRNVNFELFAPNTPRLDKLLHARSLSNLADAPDAMTVAALDVTSPYPQESYSSEGPTNGPGGTETGGFTKPDISGFANVATESYEGSTFNGTSAATPHVAGAAALVLSANPGYTPDQIQSFLEGRAIDMGDGGMDTLYGYGRLYLGDPGGGTNTAPTISGLPDQTLATNGSADNAIDLWTYAEDTEDGDADLTFAIDNTPDPDAGVSIDSNRYVDINPTTGWTGQTDVVISVTDSGGLSDTDTFQVTVSGKVWNGDVSADWHTADNWSPSGVPTSDDDVIIPNTANDPVISNGDAAVDSLTINEGAVVDLTTRTLTVEGTLTNNGTLKQTQDVQEGVTSNFLRITNLAGNETKYYGVDMTPSGTPVLVRLAGGEFDPLASPGPAGLPNALRLSAYPGDGTGYYLVQFRGPIATSDVDVLRAAGAQVLDYIPDFTFIVKMNDATRATLREIKQVRWVGLYQPAYRLTADLLARTATPVSEPSPPNDGRWVAAQVPWNDAPLDVVVSIFRGEALEPIIAQVQSMGGVVLDQSQTKWQSKLKLSISPSHLTDLAALPGVRWIEAAPEWELTNNLSADIMGVREVWDTHGLYGDGQTIAVCDSGLDQGSTSPASLHDDFENGGGASRVTAIYDWVGGGDGASDVNSGHGTHVAGSVLGNGDLSGATPSTHTYPDTAYAGMAPEANLVFQAVEDNSTGYLTGIPLDLSELFTQAITSGATLHTNSWGSSVAGMYTTDSEAVDQYVWDHPNFTILFSAGNSGVDGDSDGVIDLYSMGSPSTAKNCITVGATENNRPSGSTPTPGYDFPWGTGSWDPLYPADPIDSDHVSDNPNGMTAFSSRGPTQDGRFKPDIVAPGSNIASVRSSLVDGSQSWGVIDANYMFMGGTSMATPLTAGAATIVSQYYNDTQSVTPSAALIKATLANGATDIEPGQYGTGATQEISGTRPTNVAGWGRVNLAYSVFPTATRVMTYSQNTTGLNTAASDVYTYTVSSSAEPLHVTLAWSDYPGSPAAAGGLVNDLDLTVTGPGGGTTYPNNASQRVSQLLTYDDGASTSYLMGPAGGYGAVRFTPTSYPVTLETGLFYVLSDSGTYPKTFNWYVYDGDGATGPDTVLASGSTTIFEMGWHAVDLSDEDITISSGDFFLALELPDSDLGWLIDTSAPIDERSWNYFISWVNDTSRDYMFNAVVRSADAPTNQDRVNNLVGVDIPTPTSGVYTVTVSGYNVPQGPQPYALVASGAITTTAPNTPPSLSSLPDRIVAVNGSADNAIDLWAYASDAEDTDADMSFTIINSPTISAGVSLDANRYIDINPATDWSGVTDVVVQVQDSGGLTDTDTFQVTIDDVPNIEVTPPSLEETLFEGQIYTATLTVSNTGTAQLSFWLDAIAASWLSADPTGGAVPAGGAQSLDVIFDATGQSIGDYNTNIVVNSTDPDDTPWTVPVTMHVTAMVNTPPTLTDLPDQEVAVNGSADNAIDLWAYADDAQDADSAMTFSIINSPTISAGVSLDANRYIDINPATDWSGVTDVVVQVQDTGGLTDTDTFQVAIGDVPNIRVSPTSFEETLLEGEVVTKTLIISNTGTAMLSFWLDAIGVSWLSATPTGGAVPAGGAQSVDVVFDATGQSTGDYSTNIVVNSTDSDDTPLTVPVTMHVTTGAGNQPPTLTGLPDQEVAVNGSADNAIDLWAYASDAEDADADMTFAIINSPTISAGVSLDANRYIDINPATDWSGVTDVVVQVQDTGGLTDTDIFQVAVGDVPNIRVSPASFEETVLQGESVTQTLTISNTGTAPLTFEIREQSGAFTPTRVTLSIVDTPEPAVPKPAVGQPSLSEPFSMQSLDVKKLSRPAVLRSPQADVDLVLDDGSIENASGVNNSTNSTQFIWLNRFTPDPGEFPFTLDEIWMLFDDFAGAAYINVGDAIDLVVYEDADGDPSNGATWLATFNETVQAVDGVTWNVYTLDTPVSLNGPGDVLIAAINRYITSGVSPIAYPASFDESSPQNRSWLGWYSTDPPDPATLPPDSSFSINDSGNFTIRGYGSLGVFEDVPWLSEDPISGTVAAGGSVMVDVTLDATGLALGDYSAKLVVKSDDPDEDKVTLPVLMHVATINTPPSLTGLPDQEVLVNGSADNAIDLWAYANDAEDADADLSFAIINSPTISAGVSLDANRYIDINPATDWSGVTDVVVQVQDSGGLTDTDTLQVTITETATLVNVTVSVSGNQFCAGRISGVERCFDIDSATEISATVRFYFSEDERNNQTLDELVVFHHDGGWPEEPEPGPYTRGGAGDAQYVQAQNIGDFSLFALGEVGGGPGTIHLPLILYGWPPLPAVPVLNAISNTDGDGNYTVSWDPADLADSYTLQEDDNASFSSPTPRYTGPNTSWDATGKATGTYYYRVRASNSVGNSNWSNVQSVSVGPPDTPVLNAISNADGDGSYTVSWNAVDLAQTYALQEDDNASFSSPETRYNGSDTSWNASGQAVGTYYYRVRAGNSTGNSGWSNSRSVNVQQTIITTKLYLRDDWVLSTSPETLQIQYYFYSSTTREWERSLNGDVSGTEYEFSLMLATGGSSTTYAATILVSGTGGTQTLASTNFTATSATYTRFSATVTGLDPTTTSGDTLILRIAHVSGATGGLLVGPPAYGQDSFIVVPGSQVFAD